jgi:DNA polymerase-3 subunit beta
MKITCAKELLINNISVVAKAVAQKTTQPILECILLIADRKGFRLMTNNLELSIETSNIDSEVYELGSVALDARLFSNIIRSLPEQEVSIEVDEQNCAVIKSGRAEFKLMGKPGREFPQPPEVEKDEPIKIKSTVFKNIIKQTIFSVATEDTRPVLTGEFLEISPDRLNIVAIDGYRVSFRTVSIEKYSTYKDIIVPARTLNEISSIAPTGEDEIINMYCTDRHMLFEMSTCTMVSRLIEGQYMEYQNLFNTDSSLIVRVNREELLRALERAMLIVKDPKKAQVNLDIAENIINIESRAEIGEAFEQVSIESEGEGLTINFNANYLVDVLKNIDDDRVSLNFMSSLSPCIIKGIERDDYKYLVLPLKL